MKLARFAPAAVGAALAVGLVSGLAREASAQNRQTCHMRGVWNGASADVFEFGFDAAYVYNHGEDDFTGIYTNPGISQANISAARWWWYVEHSAQFTIDHAHVPAAGCGSLSAPGCSTERSLWHRDRRHRSSSGSRGRVIRTRAAPSSSTASAADGWHVSRPELATRVASP